MNLQGGKMSIPSKHNDDFLEFYRAIAKALNVPIEIIALVEPTWAEDLGGSSERVFQNQYFFSIPEYESLPSDQQEYLTEAGYNRGHPMYGASGIISSDDIWDDEELDD